MTLSDILIMSKIKIIQDRDQKRTHEIRIIRLNPPKSKSFSIRTNLKFETIRDKIKQAVEGK